MASSFYFETTCETIRQDAFIQQPCSFAVNVMTLLLCIVLVCLFRHRVDWAKLLLVGSVLVFEGWHTLCHANPTVLANRDRTIDITHALFLVSQVALVCVVARYSSATPTFWVVLLVLICVDLYLWRYVRKTWMILSGITITAYLVAFLVLSTRRKGDVRKLFLIGLLLACGAMMLTFEKQWCQALRQRNHAFPLHMITELILCGVIISILTFILSLPRPSKKAFTLCKRSSP